MPTGYMLVTTQKDEDPERVRAALQEAGINVSDIVETTHERSGIIMTWRMAGYTWDSQTGRDNCDGSCAENGGPPHRPLDEISPEQQHRFINRALNLMNEHRGDIDMGLQGEQWTNPPVATTDDSV
jgi:hypothetical protein